MNIPNKDELNKGTLIEKIFKKRWSEFYGFLNDNYKDCRSLSEKLYLYYNNLDKRPVCEICGAEVSFDGFFRGFKNACSLKCVGKNQKTISKRKQTNLKKFGTEYAAQNNEIKEKTKRTNLERYGVEAPLQNNTIKEKVKQTNLERYGAESATQNEYIKEKVKRTNLERYCCVSPFGSDIVKEKAKQTNLERYGVENPYGSDIIRGKIKQTNLERYGAEIPMQNESIKEKVKRTNLERYGVESAMQNESIKEKVKRTNLERYGVGNVSQNETIKEKTNQTNLKKYGTKSPLQNDTIKEKIKQTNLERYGVMNVSQNETIKEKKKQTTLDRYGVECILQNDTIKEKIKQTNLKRYGVENASQNKSIKEKVKKSFQQTTINSHINIIRYTKDGDWVCKCPHPECTKCSEKEYVTNSSLYNNRKQINSELCTKLLPIQSSYSTPELQIRNFLDSLNIEYITNNRSIIAPKELDIYIPSRNIAIEFNGSYWHSNKDKYYHQNKTKACYSKGILLVHIYEYEWNKDREPVLSKLKDILEGKEVDGIVSVKDYDKYILSEPVLIDCGSYKIWNEGGFVLKTN